MAVVVNGDGSITGLAVGGLPDGTVDADTVAADVATQAELDAATVGGATGVDFNDNVKARFGTGNDLEIYHDGSNSRIKDVGTGVLAISGNELNFNNADNSTNLLIIKDDGRGLSQFTAKVWIRFNGTGTIAINDSHNVSSITDNGTGDYTVSFSNNFGNTQYASVGMAGYSNTSQQVVSANYDGAVGSSRYQTAYNNGNLEDTPRVMIVIFGD